MENQSVRRARTDARSRPAEYNRLMGDLLSTGSQGVDMLVSMFDGTNNVPVAYALSGWAAFVSSGHEADRKVFAEGIVRGSTGAPIRK